MREILFRGKRIDNGEWIYGLLTIEQFANICVGIEKAYCIKEIPETLGGSYQWVKVDPETVSEFTGLTDKNGTKIFEGDIFKFPDEIFESYYTSCGTEYNSWEVENYGVVGFSEDLGRFDFVDYKFSENAVEADLHENHDIEFYDFVSNLEIIGNIHDNSELLKGE